MFKILVVYFANNFNLAPCGAALETMIFGVPAGAPFSSYFDAFWIVVASTIERWPLGTICRNDD